MKRITKICLASMILLQISFCTFCQTGTSEDPYISLGQAWHVPSSGIYHFDIEGTTFSSYVEAENGWILMASGSGATAEASYNTTASLTLQSDAILSSAIYTSVLITDVRINATSGPGIPLDVQSSDADVLANLQNDRTLSVGTNSDDWTGTNTARLAKICGSVNGSLSTRIYHGCGLTGNMHWIVGQNSDHEKVIFSESSKNDLNLWIRAEAVPLPIELIKFSVVAVSNQYVKLEWSTASETNNDYFTIERSVNGRDWEELDKISGAGNSSAILKYSTIDEKPYDGLSYYRLKQTDFDGQFTRFQIKSINLQKYKNSTLFIYPNPCSNKITMMGSNLGLEEIRVYDMVGKNITCFTTQTIIHNSKVIFDLSQLSLGVYYLKTKTATIKVYKQ